jgi:hypothetical protein
VTGAVVSEWDRGMRRVALGLGIALFFLLAGLFVLTAVTIGVAQGLVYPRLSAAELPSVQATVERASSSYTAASASRGSRSGGCTLHLYLDRPPHELLYDCDMPGVRAVERALARPGTAAELWYEPTPPLLLPLPNAPPRLWQLSVDGRMVLSHADVAAVHLGRTVPAILFHLVFAGLGLIFVAIAAGALLETFKPRGG